MRLLSARVRDYRLHRDLPVQFDSRFTVIAGPNQSGKSTLAEALHRALFLPVKTGGELLKGMQSDPFMAEPEVELCFEAAGERWELRKRFAGSRGSASLRDSAGRSLQGEDAEERLAELVGTAAVARNRGAAEQLKERWGHLWVWQGSASSNPFGLSTDGYDHDRLVERLQAGAALGVQSPLDLAVIDDIQNRWSAVYTAGGANRAPQEKKGSSLQVAREARIRAEGRLHADGQVDLQAELEQKQAELESRQLDEERLEKEAAMLTLLRRLLEEEQNAMATQYTAPLTERIGVYLAEVFPEAPQANLSYDARKGFQQLEWRRGNEATFGFHVLSTGACEQFAAALRVTMAEVLAEAYDGSLPVLFDDAFANSDPERQAGVYRMLQKASEQGLQVILLTCDPERSQDVQNASHIRLDP